MLAPSATAAHEVLRIAADRRGAAFGWHRTTLGRLAAELAAADLARDGRVPVGRLACVAVVARVAQELLEEDRLGRYAAVAKGPTFARAAASVIEELRLARIDADSLEAVDPVLQALAAGTEEALEKAGLIDRAGVLERATACAGDASFTHPLLGLPTLSVDLPIASESEAALLAAVVARAPDLLVTTPSGDARALAHWEGMGLPVESHEPEVGAGSLAKLQTHLFEDETPERAQLGDDVVVLSAPGESRECVEVVRRLLAHARAGVPFDRMAILLRSVEEYRPHLEEALHRAGIPAYFERGATRPDPAGRAFFALLACRAEGYSARRFSEYLSLGEVPRPGESGEPPPAAIAGDRWVPPDEELVPEGVAAALESAVFQEEEIAEERGEGTLRVPRHWERLLVEAAVIGGRDRWENRLEGLAEHYRLELREIDDPEDARSERLDREIDALATLRAFALPLLDALTELPERARWSEWLDGLASLATRSLRRPERVLSVLAELAPMGEVGPIELPAVQLVLGQRLLELAQPAPASRHGRVFIAPAEAVRGLCFDVVAVPGLAERLFPRKISEEPLLLDEKRRQLSELGAALATNDDRVARERLALRTAVGAAARSLILSYPRLDLDQSRPRVPSFYALEALRAAEGELPGFDELAARAELVAGARVGWPAPENPDEAIDEAEHDLALLDGLLVQSEEESVGTARYLLTANPHLGRALRFRARRWLRRWTEADGLTPPVQGELAAGAREAMAEQRLSKRSYSATALQNYSKCPYRFFLQAVHRLAPREEPEAIDEMDPLQRGSLVHDVQFELQNRLAAASLLPVTPEELAPAQAILDEVLDQVAEKYRDDLAPAIERVWLDGIAGVRADLREWLRRSSEDRSGFVPWRFELAFGLPPGRDRDEHSVPDPVALDCGIQLRGSIDLLERREDGSLRVTDHKTGKVWVDEGDVISGGESLQPILYALASEKLLPEQRVESGRLYYCTAAGGFEEREVPLDESARRSANLVAEVVDGALGEPFLPAAPAKGACRFCDYKLVCGPYEELRIARKWQGHEQVEQLRRLREAR